jgi:hypothetical protein
MTPVVVVVVVIEVDGGDVMVAIGDPAITTTPVGGVDNEVVTMVVDVRMLEPYDIMIMKMMGTITVIAVVVLVVVVVVVVNDLVGEAVVVIEMWQVVEVDVR